MSRGQLKPFRSLRPHPRAPHALALPSGQSVPSTPGSNRCMRWFTASATYRLPALSKASPDGSLKKPTGGVAYVAGNVWAGVGPGAEKRSTCSPHRSAA